MLASTIIPSLIKGNGVSKNRNFFEVKSIYPSLFERKNYPLSNIFINNLLKNEDLYKHTFLYALKYSYFDNTPYIYNINIFYIFILYMMTSVVDKYYRRIAQNIDNVTMKFDISALLVKSKEHDSKIDANKENISENLTLINSKFETNKNNTSENLTLINSKSDIIETNKNDISKNLTLITSKSYIIEDNEIILQKI